jgi:hypothetical protein
MKKLRIATVGVGPQPQSRSAQHIETILKMSDMYELCAFCDCDSDRLEEAGRTYGVKALYTHLDEMLRQEQPDVAYRLTPKDAIGPVCLQIAESGTNLLTEIPIAETLPMADAIIDACQRNGVKMEIAENVWVWPEEQLKREIARAGLLGDITHGRFQYPCGTYHGLSTIRKILGADPIRALGFDGEVAVLPQQAYNGRTMTKCFWEAGVFEFPDHVKVLYEMPAKGRKRPLWWEIEGTHGHLTGDTLYLYENGREVEYAFQYEFDDVGDEQVIRRLRVDTDPPVVWENPFHLYRVGSSAGPAMYGVSGKDEIARACILASMYRAVVEDTEPDYGPANARMDLEAWIAVRESAWQDHRWIDLPITQVTSVERAIEQEFIRRYGHDPIKEPQALADVQFPGGGVLWDVVGWL